MKENMIYSANDKMVKHKIFWDTIWNLLSIVLVGIIIVSTIILIKQISVWF